MPNILMPSMQISSKHDVPACSTQAHAPCSETVVLLIYSGARALDNLGPFGVFAADELAKLVRGCDGRLRADRRKTLAHGRRIECLVDLGVKRRHDRLRHTRRRYDTVPRAC